MLEWWFIIDAMKGSARFTEVGKTGYASEIQEAANATRSRLEAEGYTILGVQFIKGEELDDDELEDEIADEEHDGDEDEYE